MQMNSEKKWVWILAAISLLWSILLICGIVALTQVIIAHAEEPKTIINGEYIEGGEQEEAVEITEAPPINRISDALDEVDANGKKMEYLGEFVCTTYCACRTCNGKWGAIDGFGNPLVLGTVAVDPKVIPLKSHIVIDGYDIDFVARDTGSGVNGNHVDIFMPVSHSEALKMDQGNKRKVWIVR